MKTDMMNIKRYKIQIIDDEKWLIDAFEEKKLKKLGNEEKDSIYFCEMLNDLFDQMTHDPLTGAYNRRFLELFSAKISNPGTYVALIDINKLKDINDNEGHIAGDIMIKNVANSLKNYGFVVRFGGDEFLVIIDNEEQLNRFVDFCKNQTTFSYGISKVTAEKNFNQTMNVADSIMYANKIECYKKSHISKVRKRQ